MKKVKVLFVSLLIIVTSFIGSTPALAEFDVLDAVKALNGNGRIYANDGEFLGLISSEKYKSDSTCNEYGRFGSPYSNLSAANQYGRYGSPYSDTSAYNPRAKNPPIVIFNGKIVGHLTKNRGFDNFIDPDLIYSFMCSSEP